MIYADLYADLCAMNFASISSYLLTNRLNTYTIDLIDTTRSRSGSLGRLERIRSLIYALLDFNSIDDLKAWLVT